MSLPPNLIAEDFGDHIYVHPCTLFEAVVLLDLGSNSSKSVLSHANLSTQLNVLQNIQSF